MKTVRKGYFVIASVAVAAAALLSASWRAHSAPINGSMSAEPKIGAEPWSQMIGFRGGERAAVLAIADHLAPDDKLHVAVYDTKGKLIAENTGSDSSGNFAGVVWYPPRDAEYKIEVSHGGQGVTKAYIAVK